MKSVRLITFLGRPPSGEYSPIRYTWKGKPVPGDPTPFVSLTIARALELPPDAEVVVLCTKSSWEWQGPHQHMPPMGKRLQEAFSADNRRPPESPTRFLPEGSTSDELWEQFTVLMEALRPQHGTRRILDITHGFRVQPFFAGAAIAFVRAVHEQPLQPLQVLYGALTNGSKGELWDVTPFVELLDWTQVLMLFFQTGQGERAAQWILQLGRHSRARWAQAGRVGAEPHLKELGESLRDFSSCIATVRTGPLLHQQRSAALRLLEALRKSRKEVQGAIPPLATVLDHIENMVKPLVADAERDPRGLLALAELARLYLKFERYLEAIAVAREAWVSRFALAEDTQPGPGSALRVERREHHGKRGWRQADPKSFDATTQVRNDLLHAGFRQNARSADDLKKNVREIVDRLAEEAQGWLELCEAPSTANAPDTSSPAHGEWIFANISHHPSERWSPEQREQALELGRELVGTPLARIVDIGFPDVPPDADLAAVRGIASEVVAQLPARTAAAMVMGEHTLTQVLVNMLQGSGIACYAATSHRMVQEVGSVKVSQFQFVRFRPYPGNPTDED